RLPLAVFSMPMVLLKSVPVPVPVLLFCSIGQERSGAESGVEFALGIALEGKQTNRCVKLVAGKVKQGALPFPLCFPRHNPSRRRIDSLHPLGKKQAHKCKSDKDENQQ